MDIAEIVAFESELSDDERTKLKAIWHTSGDYRSAYFWSSLQGQACHSRPRDLGVYNLTGLVKGNTYYYRVKAENSEGADWRQHRILCIRQHNRYEFRDITFYTDPPVAWTASDGSGGNGVLQTLVDGFPIEHCADKVAKYSFNQINIGDGVFLSGIQPHTSGY